MNTITSPPAARAPLLMAAPLPMLYGWRTTRAPACSAIAAVPSAEPSSTTMISASGQAARTPGNTMARPAASLRAGRTIEREMSPIVAFSVPRNPVDLLQPLDPVPATRRPQLAEHLQDVRIIRTRGLDSLL